ncbi:uncharacterized protein LOC135216739 [Macrobrachium nipponense]|uniref:uncharacterized protein LOC135216739 n=1 Tax=Macrobrachium nipponense TaxID=159736 RepID=UPI0030C7AD2F
MQQTPPGCTSPSRGILGSILLVTLAVTASLVSPTVGSFVYVHLYKTLSQVDVTEVKLDAPSICYCRMYCMVLPNCTAVTANSTQSGPIDCFFSGHQPLKSGLEPQGSSFTFTKTDCITPFTAVDEVGCLNFVQETKTFTDAQNACKSMDAELYDAPSPEKFGLLRQYLLGKKLGSNLWVGVKDREWKRSNRPVNNESEWALGDPNEDPSFCARMGGSDYKLMDRDCQFQYYYICQSA